MTDDASPENLRKFLESDDPALVRMGLSMAKGSGVPEDLYETIIKLSILAPEEEIQKVAQSLVNLDDSDMLNLLGDYFREAEPEQRSAVISRIVNIGGSEATVLLLSELSLTEIGVEYWFGGHIIEALGAIGDEKALEGLDYRLGDECDYAKQFYMEHNPNSIDGPSYRNGYDGFLCYETASAIAAIGGNKAKEILLSYVMSHNPWWSSHVAVDYLENLGWKPENEAEKIAYLIAKHDWKGCKEMGEVAIKEAIDSLAGPIYIFGETTCVLGEIVEAVNSFGKENVVEILGLGVCPDCDDWYNRDRWESPDGYCKLCIEQLDDKLGRGKLGPEKASRSYDRRVMETNQALRGYKS